MCTAIVTGECVNLVNDYRSNVREESPRRRAR